jgi:hypothetical protein
MLDVTLDVALDTQDIQDKQAAQEYNQGFVSPLVSKFQEIQSEKQDRSLLVHSNSGE